MTDAPKVYAAIAAVTSEIAKEGISKDRKNDQQGYKFRGIDDVYNALSPIIAKHNLCILPRMLSREVSERKNAKGNALFYVTVEAEFDLISSEDGSKHTVRTFGEAMDSGDKATNKAMSAAYKYAAMQAFCIPTEGDNDADSTTHEVQPREANSTAPQSKANSRETYSRLSAANKKLATIADFDKFWAQASVTAALDSLPKDWRQTMMDEKADKFAELDERASMQDDAPPFDDRDYTPPNFDGLAA
ncbi:ERF family protein [Paradevosia shaoguanensis]|uniref:ERF family protein n=1 Tax=Paradevosia shaoguanensis TaxID=1335043 RepID=UPI001931AF8F|nr:ERF family protein [Paradevosia shaoguanensis]